jgi:hypothetical protein
MEARTRWGPVWGAAPEVVGGRATPGHDTERNGLGRDDGDRDDGGEVIYRSCGTGAGLSVGCTELSIFTSDPLCSFNCPAVTTTSVALTPFRMLT